MDNMYTMTYYINFKLGSQMTYNFNQSQKQHHFNTDDFSKKILCKVNNQWLFKANSSW